MQKRIELAAIIVFASLCSWSQTKPATTAPPKRATSAAAPAGDPTAIIETSAGKITCTLFPKVAPIGVANFIGLSNGTKDWTSPVTHAKKHGVPLV